MIKTVSIGYISSGGVNVDSFFNNIKNVVRSKDKLFSFTWHPVSDKQYDMYVIFYVLDGPYRIDFKSIDKWVSDEVKFLHQTNKIKKNDKPILFFVENSTWSDGTRTFSPTEIIAKNCIGPYTVDYNSNGEIIMNPDKSSYNNRKAFDLIITSVFNLL